MDRVSRYTYDVTRGETVTFTIEPLNGPTGRVTASQNGETLENVGSATRPRFKFRCDQVVGNNHFVVLEYTFFDGDPPDSEYETALKCSHGVSFDDIPSIKKKNIARMRRFVFAVKKEAK